MTYGKRNSANVESSQIRGAISLWYPSLSTTYTLYTDTPRLTLCDIRLSAHPFKHKVFEGIGAKSYITTPRVMPEVRCLHSRLASYRSSFCLLLCPSRTHLALVLSIHIHLVNSSPNWPSICRATPAFLPIPSPFKFPLLPSFCHPSHFAFTNIYELDDYDKVDKHK